MTALLGVEMEATTAGSACRLLTLVKLPFAARTIHAKLNQAAALALGDVTRSAIRPSEADICWLAAQHVDLTHHLTLR